MHLLGPESLTEFYVHSFEIMALKRTKTHQNSPLSIVLDTGPSRYWYTKDNRERVLSWTELRGRPFVY